MFKTMADRLKGSLSVLLLSLNTLFWSVFLFPVTALKLIIRFKPAVTLFNRVLNGIARLWISCNNLAMKLTQRAHWHVSGTESLSDKKWYLVLANHQSWTDIVVLQKIFNGKIPFLKFFLKKELIWVPVLGPAWWALDFPFMKRYSASFLERKPHLKGKDIEITKKACAKFRHIPVSIMNFVEGTRFTKTKHQRQESPYRNLLKPKSGGVGFVFSTMGEQLSSVLNVTIAYPGGPWKFWDFLCGKVREIRVHVEELPVTRDLIGNYVEDHHYRERFQRWLNELWEAKDRRIDEMMGRIAAGHVMLPGVKQSDSLTVMEGAE